MRKTYKPQRIISSLYPGEGLIMANAFGIRYAQEVLTALEPVIPVTIMAVAEYEEAISSFPITFTERRRAGTSDTKKFDRQPMTASRQSSDLVGCSIRTRRHWQISDSH